MCLSECLFCHVLSTTDFDDRQEVNTHSDWHYILEILGHRTVNCEPSLETPTGTLFGHLVSCPAEIHMPDLPFDSDFLLVACVNRPVVSN